MSKTAVTVVLASIVASLSILLAMPLPTAATNGALALALPVIALWATGLVPEDWTAMALFTVAMLSGWFAAGTVFAGFASSALWLVVAGMILGQAIAASGLATRGARALAPVMAGSRLALIAGTIGMGIALAFVMPSAMGRVLLLVPVLLALAEEIGFAAGSRDRAVLIATGMLGTYLPGFAILPSNIPNMVLVGLMEAQWQAVPTYAAYLALHFPILGAVKMLTLGGLAVVMIGKPAGAMPERPQTNPLTPGERRLAGLLIATVVLWAADFTHGISPAWIGMAAALVCLIPAAGMARDDIVAGLKLGPILFVAGVIGLGMIVADSGLGAETGRLLAHSLPIDSDAPFVTYMTLGIAAMGVGLLTTLPGAPAALMPMADALIAATGWSAQALAMSLVVGFSNVVLPYQAPPLVVGARLAGVPVSALVRLCLWMTALTLLLLLPLNYLWWRLLGTG